VSTARHRAAPVAALHRHRVLAIGLVAVVLGALAYPAYRHFRPSLASCTPTAPAATVDGYAGTMTGDGPWTRNCADLAQRLTVLRLLPYDPRERVHRHTHLDLFVDGKRRTVPAGVGLDQTDTPVSPVHTHNPDGIVHVESPVDRAYSLAEFFAVWGLRTTGGCLGGYCPTGDRALHVFVNGSEVAPDLAAVKIVDKREITVSYGTTDEVRKNVPTGFTDWPPV
jgi:hypothetical protein